MTDSPTTSPVTDWTTDYDIFDADYIADPFSVWDDLREECPVAHTERWGESWLPTRYEDVVALARMVPELSSNDPIVVRPAEDTDENLVDGYRVVNAPPISADPPVHTWSRRMILPAFSPRMVEEYEVATRTLCKELIAGFIDKGELDGAVDYAQQIPPRVIAILLGVDANKADTFVEWVRGVLEIGLSNPVVRKASSEKIREFFFAEIADRRINPGDDMISDLLKIEIDGEPLSDMHVMGTCNLLLVAGIDTTWSGIGSALWHLATHPEDRQRLVDEPELIPTAIEEFLRAYAPVTMARLVKEEVEFNGCPFKPNDKILMNFPAANRDPEQFEDADKVIIDREKNRHIAFGVGIHRCAGSNLARMEMRVAVEEFLAAIPEFSIKEGETTTWSGGQVRGPRLMPMVFES